MWGYEIYGSNFGKNLISVRWNIPFYWNWNCCCKNKCSWEIYNQDCYQIMQMVYYNTKHQRLPEFWPPILEIWLNLCLSTIWSPQNIKKNTKHFAIPVNRHFNTKLWQCFDFTRLQVGSGLLSNWYVHSHFRYNQIIQWVNKFWITQWMILLILKIP